MAAQDSDPAAACPVDHKTREAWLAQAKKANPSQPPPASPHAAAPPPVAPLATPGCDSSAMEASQSASPSQTSGIMDSIRKLGTQREISTIPRARPSENGPAEGEGRPANNERDTGADKKTGNWIYPSEQMFFDAMKRKSYAPAESDMHAIVPIHNAVNERAWAEIKRWEANQGAEACGGPKLASFSGLSSSLTPRARWNTWVLGYKPPFDRHDWVVDRCGVKVEYVIDFYAGRDEGVRGKDLNFYLDVRPKLNSWEGVKMRAFKFLGL